MPPAPYEIETGGVRGAPLDSQRRNCEMDGRYANAVVHVVLKWMDANGVKGCVVPLHSELATGTLRGVRQAGVSLEEFGEQLKQVRHRRY